MPTPRFGIKSLLVAFALVALWLSTFSGYAAAKDVRDTILLVVFLAAGFACVCYSGRRRAFWAGFFLVMLIFGCRPIAELIVRYMPDQMWITFVSERLAGSQFPNDEVRFSDFQSAIYMTIWAGWMFSTAALVGFIGAGIYEAARQGKNRD